MSDIETEIGGATGFSGQALEDIASGQPVYVNRVTGKLGLAAAITQEKATAVGLTVAAIASGFVGQVDEEFHTEADWTAIAGAAMLAVGQTYFLSATPGQITNVAPTSIGQYVTVIGVAIDPTTLSIQLGQPILL